AAAKESPQQPQSASTAPRNTTGKGKKASPDKPLAPLPMIPFVGKIDISDVELCDDPSAGPERHVEDSEKLLAAFETAVHAHEALGQAELRDHYLDEVCEAEEASAILKPDRTSRISTAGAAAGNLFKTAWNCGVHYWTSVALRWKGGCSRWASRGVRMRQIAKRDGHETAFGMNCCQCSNGITTRKSRRPW
ncbi:MAG: hypothetical protein VX992_07550, partial [Acidobacteriota bacterium]|nr:hypothetical protein [Acidobacteriota bacterium]